MRDAWDDETSLRVLVRLINEYPDAPFEEIEALYFAKAKASPRLIEEALSRILNSDWDILQKRNRVRRPLAVEEIAERAEKRAAERAAREAAVEATIKLVKAVVLLDLVQPNGKKLRDCTGGDIRVLEAQMPSWFKAIAAKVQPDQIVGEVLTEDDVRKAAPIEWSAVG
jgi:hypothetical protein